LQYMSQAPQYRKFHHRELTFRGVYAFSENVFVYRVGTRLMTKI